MENAIYIPQPQADALLFESAIREISVEELLNAVIKKYMERMNEIG